MNLHQSLFVVGELDEGTRTGAIQAHAAELASTLPA